MFVLKLKVLTYYFAALLKSPMTAYTLPTLSSARDTISGRSLNEYNFCSTKVVTRLSDKRNLSIMIINPSLLFLCNLQVIEVVSECKVRVPQFKVSVADAGVQASYKLWLIGDVPLR